MGIREWALSVKPDLVKLQKEKGIPALWAAAQMCHESYNGNDGLSGLAQDANNFAGLKWAEWERAYGCEPVSYGTWEVLDGQRVDLTDAFCKCPDWETWLKVYGDLLTGRYYSPALAYGADPFLYGYHIWKCGWATDPNYLVGTGHWLTELYDLYADTLPTAQQAAAAPQTIPIKDANGNLLAEGWLENSKTVVPLRKLAEALGVTVEWDDATQSVTLRK